MAANKAPRQLVAATFLIVGGAAFASASPALAQDQTTQNEFAACLAIENAAQRLACFDTLARGLSQLSEAPQPDMPPEPSPSPIPPPPTESSSPNAVPDEAEAPEAGANNFGSDSISYRNRDLSDQEMDEVTVYITAKRKNARNRWVMTTNDGQVWQQMDHVRIAFGKGDAPAVISRGMMGSYKILVEGNSRPARVKRIR